MRMVVNINHIRAEKGSDDDLERQSIVEYPMDLYIREVKETGLGRVSIPFSLETKTSPQVASFMVSGELLVSGSEEEVEALTAPTGREPPKVWKMIYQETVNILSVLARVIEVPFPAPNMGGVTVDS